MSDPFRPETNHQLIREARFGLMLIAITVGIFSYVVYQRLTGSANRIPEHVLRAPVATRVWPGDERPDVASINRHSHSNSQQSSSTTFGSLIAQARNSFGLNFERQGENSRLVNQLTPKHQGQNGAYQDPVSEPQLAASTSEVLPRQSSSPDSLDRNTERKNANQVIKEQARNELENSRKQLPPLPLEVNELRPNKVVESKQRHFPKLEVRPAQPLSYPGKASQNSTASLKRDVQNVVSNSPTKNRANTFTGESNSEMVAVENGFETVKRETPRNHPVPDDAAVLHASHANSSRGQPDLKENFLTPRTNDFASNFSASKSENSEIALSNYQSPIIASAERESTLTGQAQESFQQPNLDQQTDSNFRSMQQPATEGFSDSNLSTHKVMAGESFWSIAQDVYGDGRFFRSLFEYNRKTVGSFENLVPGNVIQTPPRSDLVRMWPELCPGTNNSHAQLTDVDQRMHVTKQGDTLFEIARQTLGQASRYLEIQQLNVVRLPKNVNHLTPLPADLQLVIPLPN